MIVGEVIGQGKFVCAVGGHSFELQNCIGTLPMSMSEAKKTKYAFHVTKSRRRAAKLTGSSTWLQKPREISQKPATRMHTFPQRLKV